jgi:hypothetical protein
MTAAVTERPAWLHGVEIRYGADGETLNAEEIVTAWWRYVIKQDDKDSTRRIDLAVAAVMAHARAVDQDAGS